MYTVICLMVSGVLVGYFLRDRGASRISSAVTPLIWLLLFLLGVSVGGNSSLMDGLFTLGVDALYITIGAVLGSVITAWALWFWIKRRGGM